MAKSNQISPISKLLNGFKGKGTLRRQKTIGKGKGATPSVQVVALPPDVEYRPCSRDRLPLPPPPMADAICQLPYYHPHLTSKDDLTNFMSQYSLQEGYFLLRKSFKEPTSYTITVNHRSGLKHIRVVMNSDRFSLKDRSFDTIDELIQFYSRSEIPNEENIPGILLRFPIRRPPVEFGEYILVSTQSNPKSPSTSPYLAAFGSQDSQDHIPPQPPPPRQPAALPRGISCPSNPTTSLGDQTKPLPVTSRLPKTVVPPPAPRKASADVPVAGTSSATNPTLPTNHIVSSKPIGPSSPNVPNPSTDDTISPKPIGPPSRKDTILSTSIGPPSPRARPSDAPPTADAFQNERCDCGLLMREASLPLGWSVHVSQDSDTKNQRFFLSPNNETNWELPLNVALHLSPEQQDLIRNLGFDSDIKVATLRPGHLITSSLGCSSKTNKGCLGETTTATMKTWVSCDDYESSKSLREALQQPVRPMLPHPVHPKKSEHSTKGGLQHPKTDSTSI